MTLSIRKKLTLSFLLVALLVGILGFASYSNLKDTANQAKVITERETPVLVRLSEMKTLILEGIDGRAAERLLEETQETAEFSGNLEPSDPSVPEFGENARISQSGLAEQAELLSQLAPARAAMVMAARTLIENFEREATVNPSDIAEIEAGIDRVIPLVARFLEIENQEVVEAQLEIQATIASAERQTLVVVSIAIVLAIGLGLLLSRSISVPINRLKDVAEELGEGNLGVRANVDSRDEIGSLANSFNQMAAARQQAEEQSGVLIAELEDKNAELEDAYEELRTLDKLKDEFISTVSHELRTPLTSIKGAAEILLNYQDEDPAIQAEFLNIIDGESDRLTRLINDVLDLARMESGQMQFRTYEVELPGIIETALDSTHPLTAQQNLTVEFALDEELPTVASDPDRLVQVITNLLSNAIKFTPSGGLIQVRARLLPVPDPDTGMKMVEVSVSDNGVGIPESEFAKIFHRFQQVTTTLSGRPRGTGLGLPISKEIVERLGGAIWVESEPGKGSTFFFTIPVDRSPEKHLERWAGESGQRDRTTLSA